jgi:hypothetical protein
MPGGVFCRSGIFQRFFCLVFRFLGSRATRRLFDHISNSSEMGISS